MEIIFLAQEMIISKTYEIIFVALLEMISGKLEILLFDEKKWFLRLLSVWVKVTFFDVLKQFNQHFQDCANLLFFDICPKCCKKGDFLLKSAPPAWQILDILLLVKKGGFYGFFQLEQKRAFLTSSDNLSNIFKIAPIFFSSTSVQNVAKKEMSY